MRISGAQLHENISKATDSMVCIYVCKFNSDGLWKSKMNLYKIMQQSVPVKSNRSLSHTLHIYANLLFFLALIPIHCSLSENK